jgi:LysM repeat protein
MTLFGDLFTHLRQHVRWDFQMAQSLEAFTRLLNGDGNTTIRMWVDGTPGSGHQTSTVGILRQLVGAPPGFGYTGLIEVYYNRANDTLAKLYMLLPELGNAPRGRVGNAQVDLIEWTEHAADRVQLGFTGGADDVVEEGKTISPNYARKIGVDYLLRLQPYRWPASEQIQFASDARSPITLTDERVLGMQSFRQRAYYVRTPFPVPDWAVYAGDPSKQRAAEIVQWLTTAPAMDALAFMPVYSIRTSGNLQFSPPPQARMFEVVTAVFASQRAGALPRPGAASAFVLSCDTFDAAAVDALDRLIKGGPTDVELGWQEQLERGETQIVEVFGKSTTRKMTDKERADLQQQLRGHAFRRAYLEGIGAAGRFAWLINPTLEDIRARQAWLAAAPDRVVFVQLGSIPEPLFNYLLQNASLPPVFEGQNTANTMLNLGGNYLHVARPASTSVQYPSTVVNYAEYREVLTDAPMMPWVFVPLLPSQLQAIANQLNWPLELWPARAAENPAEQVGGYIRDYAAQGADGPYRRYFDTIRNFYRDVNNDKLRYGAAFLQYIVSQQQPAAARARQRALACAAPSGPMPPRALDARPHAPVTDDSAALEALLARLQDNRGADGALNLVPGAFSDGSFRRFYTELLGAGKRLLIEASTITPERDGDGVLVSIEVRGASAALGFRMATVYTFTAPQGAVVGNGRFTHDDAWSPPELPWLRFSRPFVELYTTDADLPSVGAVGGTLDSAGVEVAFKLPVSDAIWELEGHFPRPYPSIAKFYQMAGGVNLLATLPAPFGALAGFGVSTAQLAYDAAAGKIQYVGITATTQESVSLLPGLTMQDIGAQVTVQDPAALAARRVDWSVQGTFRIGSGPDAGVVTLGANGPGLVLRGQLASGLIRLTDLLAIFLPGVKLDPQGIPVITGFEASVTPATGQYTMRCDLNVGWTLTFPGPTIEIRSLTLNASRNAGRVTGNLSGQIALGSADHPFLLTVSASYDPQTSWTFGALQQQGTTFDLAVLFNQFLPAEWKITQSLEIADFSILIPTASRAYLISGRTASPWAVPFISGLNVSASLRAGYLSPSQADASAKGGYVGRVETQWNWHNIDLAVWFDYRPGVRQYGITWGMLEGIVRGPDPDTQDWTATLRFTESTTLGSLIETMVSWATGSRFGLESPWDLLNAVPLSGLALKYTFNKNDQNRNTVAFSVLLGPIDLGFARIDGIDVKYASTGDDRGVRVSLKGAFFWQSNPNEPLAWDASEPGAAPTPPGNGNKYLDLRLLAMGQHITLPGFAAADTVQKAIALMETLPLPRPGEVPPVVFDPQSAWLIGTHFGVLKIDAGESGAGNGAAPGYALTLQAVFNDPHLYGLRVALDGPAAKVFKGLDFQIMYRQVSDAVGVYQAEITLPDRMRHLTVGAYSITLPTFGIAIYTNGDFQADIGFPWNENFSRSFTIEAIIPPGIPVIGSAGFYFGKLSSASTNRVPVSPRGTFNPVLVFGFGMQVGFGKSIEYGILSAGFSITAVGILEGVLAKWNPYRLTDAGREPSTQLQGDYYFWLRGTVGIVGKIYGSVDFAIVKADVNVTVKLLLQLTYESYVSITITVIASVDVAVKVRINLGLFKITLSFSFSMRLKETFAIENAGTAPWLDDGRSARGMLRAPVARRLSPPVRLGGAALDWRRLQPGAVTDLWGYLAPGLTAARDEWTPEGAPASQLPCWVALLLIEAAPPAGQDGDAGARKASGSAPDTSFEALAKMVLRWVVAAARGDMTAAEVDRYVVPAAVLDWLAGDVLVSTDDRPAPIPLDAVQAFLATQFRFNLRVPPTDRDATADAAYFPAPPQLRVTLPEYGAHYPGASYTLGSYNALGADTLVELRAWFDQLAVQVEREQKAGGARPRMRAAEAPLSMAGWMFADYFLLLARQMVKAAQEALRDYKYPLNGSEQVDGIVQWVNRTGQLDGAYTLHDVFASNPQHTLAAGKALALGVTVAVDAARTGTSFAALATRFDDAFSASALAGANAADPTLLRGGATIVFAPHAPYTVVASDTLVGIAAHYAVTFNDLLAGSSVLAADGLLADGAQVRFPFLTRPALATDTFASVAAAPVYAGAFNAIDLALANAGRSVLLAGAKVAYPDKTAYVVQPRDTLGDVANALGVRLADLVAKSAVLTQTGLLAPVASLALPPFRYATRPGDTLAGVAARFGATLDVLADQSANGGVVGLFAADAPLDLPHLPQFPVGELLAEAQRTGALQHLSGMASSYTMHGMRFPTSGRTDAGKTWSIVPQARGMWVRGPDGQLTLPPQAGLYALTGQQIPLPTLDTHPFAARFDRVDGVDTAWLRFADAQHAPVDHLTLSVTPGSADAVRIAQVEQAARTRLDVPLDALGAGEMFHAALATYPFTSALPWLSAEPASLPYGAPPAGGQSLRLWRLPDALAALPDPAVRAVNPRFALRVARYDEATGATDTRPVAAYGWASTIDFTVRRIPPVAESPASAATYEVIGAGGAAIVLLERLLSQLQANDGAYGQLRVGYAPDGATGAGPGVQTDGAASVTLGIAQANLSTETRPGAARATADLLDQARAQPALTLLNPPSEFVRLLWEASITRSGGFFLYYYDRAAQRGLPDHLFNDRGEAALTLVVLYAKPAHESDQDRVAGYMNAVATADRFDGGNAVLFAEAAPVPTTVAAGAQTLADLARQWFCDPAELAEANAHAALRAGVTLRVSEGVYQAPPGGIALRDLAQRFGITVPMLNQANPRWGGLPDPLPHPAAIRVPDLMLTAGAHAHTASLADVSGWYGEPVAALGAHNRLTAGLFAAGGGRAVPGGPRVRTASVQPGVQALAASRPAPPPVDGASSAYGTALLLNNFSLLNQQVHGNVDFRASLPPGLPAGPTTRPLAANGDDKMRVATPVEQVETWNFGQALPYARFAKQVPAFDRAGLPPAKDSPYLGVGGILQVSFSWQDYYGNVLATRLSDPKAGDPPPLNDAPLLTGYTDPLIALSQWPSVAASWRVTPGGEAGAPRLRIGLGFDPGRYQGLLRATANAGTTVVVVFTDALDAASASEPAHWRLAQGTVIAAVPGADGKTVTLTVSPLARDTRHTLVVTDVKAKNGETRYSGQAAFDWPDHPATSTSTVQQNAAQDLHVYTRLYYQLTDPARIAFSVQSTLLAGADGQPGSLPLPSGDVDRLTNWLFGTGGAASIFAFVLDRSRFGTGSAPPAAALALDLAVPPAALNPAQVFPLWTSFTLARSGGAVLAGLEATDGIRSASTRIAPLQDAIGAGGGALGLVTFATGFEQALSAAGRFRLKVATGVDRTASPATGGGGALWAVRLGLAAGQAISYAVTDAGKPAVFAPQPASNRLISRTDVPLYDYATGKGISATPSRRADFTDVDLDTWCAQLFAAVDEVLTPPFTAPIQIVGELKSDDYLRKILAGKKSLARLAKLWMIPVFAGEQADPSAAREAFYQQLLVQLSAAYTTRAAVEFHANVTADVAGAGADFPPRLFGPVVRLGPTFEAATVAIDTLATVLLLFSDPLDPAAAGDAANYALSDGIGVVSAAVADATVTLTLTRAVQPGQTTVTVGKLRDTQKRPLRAPLTRTVTTGSADLPARTLTFSAPKLTLQTGPARNLTYLLNAPASVRGAGGELVSYVELDMAYRGDQIEHQIGALPGIDGYQASTWLSFVAPDSDQPLTAELGGFAVPMVLRAFPASPGMTAQEGTPTHDPDEAALSDLKRWDYALTYSLPFHYPQDSVSGTVEFNLRKRSALRAGFPDAFAQLAEFVTVFPQVSRDLQTLLADIDATVEPAKDQQKIDDAAVALQSFIRLVDDLVRAAGGAHESAGPGLRFAPQPRARAGDPLLTYAFIVEERSARVGDTERALVVSLSGAVPEGMGAPVVEVDPARYAAEPWTPTDGAAGETDRFHYVYRRKAGPGPDGAYLTAADGQAIAERTVRLPALDILERQDAWSTVWVERNRELVPGRPSADAFVYTTPEVRFANPLYPTNDAAAEVDVSKVPTGKPEMRPLQAHLDALFAALLPHDTQPQIAVQVEATYAYTLNDAFEPIVLPVLMQAPLRGKVTGTGAGAPDGMTSAWADAIGAWFSAYLPAGGGTLWLDLTLMSTLTDEPMPLLRLRRLKLPIGQVAPPLPCR